MQDLRNVQVVETIIKAENGPVIEMHLFTREHEGLINRQRGKIFMQ